MTSFSKTKNVSGMTFIEVLVSLVILVTGILGAVAMQASAKKGSFDAMQRSMASALTQDMIERMRSNTSTTAILNTYAGTYSAITAVPTVRCNTPTALCTPVQRVTNDLYEWTQSLVGADVTSGGQNTGGLIGASGCIAEAANAVTVTISWQGREKTSDGAAATNSYAVAACGTGDTQRRQVSVKVFIY